MPSHYRTGYKKIRTFSIYLNNANYIGNGILFQIIKAKKEEFFSKPENDQDKEFDENENFKTPQIFIQQLFKLYKKKLVDDTMIKDQVNLLIFGVEYSKILLVRHRFLFLTFNTKGK